jgi:hypothetical protein
MAKAQHCSQLSWETCKAQRRCGAFEYPRRSRATREVKLDCCPVPLLAANPDGPAGLLDEAVNDAQTQLGFPLPDSFVVKNGSNTLSSSAEGMPVPVLLTAIIT